MESCSINLRLIHPPEDRTGKVDLPRDRPLSSTVATLEQSERQLLFGELARLRNENEDLQIALLTSNEHGDLLQEHLYRLSDSLAAEVRERQATEERLQQLIQAITKEKGDLEILVEILIDQGDDSAEEGKKARIDGLTQIANRRRFDEYLLQEWGRHFRLKQRLSLLICDVDHFKRYNDMYGHQAGDECLKGVARAISHYSRSGDLVARYGGEEFAIVLPNTVEEADRQLYFAKHGGRNQVAYQGRQTSGGEEKIG